LFTETAVDHTVNGTDLHRGQHGIVETETGLVEEEMTR